MTTTPGPRKKDAGQAGNGGEFAARTSTQSPVSLPGPARDMTWWEEEDRAFPASLYEAGLDGTLEPYNGDYPVKDGALRYWREDMSRELVIGESLDGTMVVAVEAGADEGIYVSADVEDPTPESIVAAVGLVREQAAGLPSPEE